MANFPGPAMYDKKFRFSKWKRTINNNKTYYVSLPKMCQTVCQPLNKCHFI